MIDDSSAIDLVDEENERVPVRYASVPVRYASNRKSINALYEVKTLSNMTLSVKLDEYRSVIEGNLTIDYYNKDPITFDRIPFHLYLSGMSNKSRQGEIDVLNVTTVGPSSTNLSYEVLSDQQLMWVDLDSPLGPSQSVSLNMLFNSTLPDSNDRANSNGFDGNQSRVYTCTAFYPIPCVYDEYDEWNNDIYLSTGDPFYFDMANYELVVEVPDGMIVAATGEMLDNTSDGVTSIYHYKPNHPVREVVFSASRYFVVESEVTNGVNVTSYYLPHSSELWKDVALDAAVNSLILFNNSFDNYPYTTFNVVEAYGFYGGMEYPCQVQITESINSEKYDDPVFRLELVIVHEVAHQWWSQIVGNDQVDWGHLDEGITCWSTDYYFDYYNPDWNYFGSDYWANLEVRDYNEPSKINQSAYGCIETNTSYSMTAYRKAPLILQNLRVTIGHENYMAGLKHFYQEYGFKIATFPDLQKSFENVTGNSLDWFFIPWFDNTYLPRYSFKNVDYIAGLGTMSVIIEDINEKKNDHAYSQQLVLQVIDIRSEGIFYSEKVWINGTTTIEFDLTVKGNPGAVLLVHEPGMLGELTYGAEDQTWFRNNPCEFYSDDSWFEQPNLLWVPVQKGDWVDWDYNFSYTDSMNILEPEEGTGIVRCDILDIILGTRTVTVETNMSWSPKTMLLESFIGLYNFTVDQEGHATPDYMPLISLFIGPEFRFTDEWIDSLVTLVDFQSVVIYDDGMSIEMHMNNDNDYFEVVAEYNAEGLLVYFDLLFDPFYPVGTDGPTLSGKLTLNLRSAGSPVMIVELAVIGVAAVAVVSTIVYVLVIRKRM
jgi:hypothetical protein